MENDSNTLNRLNDYRRRPRRRVNWRQAADLLARGLSLEAAAERLNCSLAVLRRNLRRSPQFRDRIQQAAEQRRLRVQLRFLALGEDAAAHLQPEQAAESRILQWLGSQAGAGTGRLAAAALQDTDLAARFALALGLTTRKRLSAEEANARQVAAMEAMLTQVRSEDDR
jgi:hypothetical protein